MLNTNTIGVVMPGHNFPSLTIVVIASFVNSESIPHERNAYFLHSLTPQQRKRVGGGGGGTEKKRMGKKVPLRMRLKHS